MSGEGGMGGSLATRRNISSSTVVKQENMDAPIRGAVPNGYPAGMSVCPPRGNPTSNLSTYFLKYLISPSFLFIPVQQNKLHEKFFLSSTYFNIFSYSHHL